MIPFQVDVTHAQQIRITNIEVYSMMPTIVPLRLMLLRLPKGYLCLLYSLNYIAYILLSTFVWIDTPQHIHYSPNILPINQLKMGLLGRILCGTIQSKLYKWHTRNPLAIPINCH